ncbi:hypothetical protein [Pelagicoccus sp. SDUM812003]|uniref:hypothetical protein n=1 Tax=Pelagicoccus sp. SDUM812003 TaxID=3041267 RepID=UPI00280DBAAA|nr:hypothetical protein [Pelagicoccus sp. SDUM812003]MDQ8201570.1 hypothetical protein [Pelagicoccus sp. SDUM812003]
MCSWQKYWDGIERLGPRPVYIYGAGPLGQKAAAWLRALEIGFEGLIDRDEKLGGERPFGTVFSPNVLRERGPGTLLVACGSWPWLTREWERLGWTCRVFSEAASGMAHRRLWEAEVINLNALGRLWGDSFSPAVQEAWQAYLFTRNLKWLRKVETQPAYVSGEVVSFRDEERVWLTSPNTKLLVALSRRSPEVVKHLWFAPETGFSQERAESVASWFKGASWSWSPKGEFWQEEQLPTWISAEEPGRWLEMKCSDGSSVAAYSKMVLPLGKGDRSWFEFPLALKEKLEACGLRLRCHGESASDLLLYCDGPRMGRV